MNKIIVTTDIGMIPIHFENFNMMYEVASYQMGIFTGLDNPDEFCKVAGDRITRQWDEKFKLGAFNLQRNSTILDIGGGVGLLDIVLLKYLADDSVVYILDKTAVTKKNKHWGTDHGFYNNRMCTLDLIKNNDIQTERLKFIDPSMMWPEKIDLIMSNNSYMWHYPKEVYWDKIRTHALTNCKLAFDIFNRQDADYVLEIEQDINRRSVFSSRPTPNPQWYSNEIYDINGTYGRTAVWI